MHKKVNKEQKYFEDFYLPFGGRLRADNEWVKLAKKMPWDFIKKTSSQSMSENSGAGTISALIAFGSLFIKEQENLSDRCL